eukprot:CAMPEP_0202485306 /NCGR_PEP_ID=MMETSP1361-20130828/4180_1 /ASSEMBLY_ACC=CAM_ASM_000849 /TAXON_ID=210615 /ORGANISM="Staurosira complex sp., Strain CCMP2646" /LENGTH=282 /DNA_ID=CAMNT_0049114177 /DNA_START=30 /DNA_END=878 /DNA_ORIENTATION=-
MTKSEVFALAAIALYFHFTFVASFTACPTTFWHHRTPPSYQRVYLSSAGDDLKNEAAELLEKARQLRESLPAETITKKTPTQSANKQSSRWTVPESDSPGVGYRLYIGIGREQGTWMEPRWGASGKRIEFTLDVKFLTETAANQTVANRMVKDNFGGTSYPVYELITAPKARLRSGFDEMASHGGGYRIDTARNGGGTARFHILVDGTPHSGSSYGDIFVPKGCLYFSIPVFGNSISQLSSKEGPLTVRRIGWHTGWRREESQMVGTFRVVPIEKAQRVDGF